MAEHQKIHPVDIETPATVPLVPHQAQKSDSGSPGHQYPSQQRTIPVKHSRPPRKRSCLCRCFCWTISLLLLIVIVIAAIVGILFLVFQPKLPKYSVNSLRVSEFTLNTDMSLSAQFNVMVTARNPNKKIGIYYGKGSRLRVYYTNIKLCEGSLPKFYQGHRNTTELDIALTGQTNNASTLLTTLSQEQQTTGTVPLNLRADVPIRVKLGKLKLPRVKFVVKCNLVVDNLTANNSISIRSSKCKFRLRH
ncbi:hypothetical protein GIB67_003579 [Kingdonia uniflora]|uniref:Late embryogenesis abundant protein LEA-2 subgroup domain-containing protein n=1 Tax=Kingdonia uniflora TaxID=39325 RepID=A0A7J7MEN5_9MAGN|nr:hypothetical protein GIB67_003579 [Kingdonia uniflora]